MESNLKQPLLAGPDAKLKNGMHSNSNSSVPVLISNAGYCTENGVTEYTRAGLFSRATFSWMNNLLRVGAHKTIQKEDVPILAPQHRAARLYSLFTAKWPAATTKEDQDEPNNTVLRTLWRSFWGPFLFCGFLAFIKLWVMFAGPLLVRSFVDYASGTVLFPCEGVALVGILASAKVVEVIAAHQYNFCCQKLGMQIRSALITSIFRKGLRLSSSSRQFHGVGSIVNYMSVDVQQMSDVMLQLHTVWVVPVQVVIAVSILASVVGVATLAGLAVMFLTASITLLIAFKQNAYQEKIMGGRDRRMKAFNESLSNMKVIKLQGWESRFLQGVEDARNVELFWLSKYVYSISVNIFLLWLTPLAACVAIFAACIYLNVRVTPALAFTTIATVRIMQEPMRIFPQALIAVSQALVSLRRLDRFFWSIELEATSVARLPIGSSEVAISVENASFKWDPEQDNRSLSNINMHVPSRSLVAVVGKVGSGKTSLLASLLGEMHKITGKVELTGRIAYVAQSAWIQHGTIEDNILFGLPMDRVKYDDTLQQCALLEDLQQMKLGDKTEIGERGINLSGGQRQRVQLARAVYQDCDVYLLDDVFSALDTHTGSQIFKECVLVGLADKTVILITHQLDFLHKADSILVMRDGSIVQSGRYEDLLVMGLDFESLVKVHNEAMEKVSIHGIGNVTGVGDEPGSHYENHYLSTSSSPISSSCESTSYFPAAIETNDIVNSMLPRSEEPEHRLLLRPNSRLAFEGTLFVTPSFNETEEGPLKLIKDEERATGRVSPGMYWLYLTSAFGGFVTLVLVFTQVIWQALLLVGDYWIAYETSASWPNHEFQPLRFLTVYAELALACAFCVLIRSSLVSFVGLVTTQDFYLKMLQGVFRAPMSFFDTTPTGRILSRASTDQAQLDILVPILFGAILTLGFASAGILVVVAQITWQILILVIPLGWMYYSYQVYYITTSRELTRVDAMTKAPIIHHFSETIAGVLTIRCFGHEDRFAHANMQHVDTNLRMDFHNNAANEWLGFRLEVIGTIVLIATTILLVSLPTSFIRPELVGLSLSYALSFNATLFNAVWIACQLENKMVAVERIAQYTNLPMEAQAFLEQTQPPTSWPSKGTIKFKDLKLRYRPNTPLVLKGITMTIKGGSKVGVVGRTGSGKSSLVLALFRLIEATSGCIVIDNIDISTLGLRELRMRMSIIPQDPTLFDGTIRSNLDPMEQYSDHEIWEVLEKCQLSILVRQFKAKLESPVIENGENWSVGQRQLFCLGRALLKQSRILVLDEATASVDAYTDAMIQAIVSREFISCTVITIAHRVATIMESDKILVLNAGLVQEYDSPSNLLQRQSSMFASLVFEHSSRSTTPSYD